MLKIIKDRFSKYGIDRIGAISVDNCEIINMRILPPNAKSVIMFCIPYRSEAQKCNDGFSEYSRIYDYHKFSHELYDLLIPDLQNATGINFYGFCDHSPINEKTAAARCGLGVIGRNSLFIDNKYGSFVFLGSLIADRAFDIPVYSIEGCINCKKCLESCPGNAILDHGIERNKCLSGISQKKNKSEEEKLLLKRTHIVWGCDICQDVCPYNKNAKISPIKYFAQTRANLIDIDFINSLSDEEFNKFAFSYKGRKIITEGIENIN